MASDVLDASAIFAVLHQEPGAERVAQLLSTSNPSIAVSSVNFCEVLTKLVRNGGSPAAVDAAVKPFRRYVVDFSLIHATRAGELTRSTQMFGLSLGDRACLALAESMQATAWTTDRIWSSLSVGVKIYLIR